MYYIERTTVRINPDGTEEIRDQLEVPYLDESGDALHTAEQNFRDELIENLRDEFDDDVVSVDDGADYRYTETWYSDRLHTETLLQISFLDSQLRPIAEKSAIEQYAPPDSVYIGQAVVDSEYSDVTFARERLYKCSDGTYIKQTMLKMYGEDSIEYETRNEPISVEEARTWCKQHLDSARYRALFGMA